MCLRGMGLHVRRKALEQDVELERDARTVDLIYEYEARITALDRLVGRGLWPRGLPEANRAIMAV